MEELPDTIYTVYIKSIRTERIFFLLYDEDIWV